jgi:leucyl aminopeptidase
MLLENIKSPFTNFRSAGREGWQGDIVIVPAGAAESPGLEQPGKSVGDLVLLRGGQGEPPRLLVSLGPADKIDAEMVRRAGGAAAKWLEERPAQRIGVDLAAVGLPVSQAAAAFTEGLLLGAFRFERLKSQTEGNQRPPGEVFFLADGEQGEINSAAERAARTAHAANLARSLNHEPANVINPLTLAELAVQLGQSHGLTVTVLGEKELAELGAGALQAVGQGSRTPSQLIVVEYAGKQRGANPVVLVGKAITFDTGGYSLKDRAGMVGMKYDKSGGVTVLALMQAAAELDLDTPVVGLIAAAENMVSAEAYRPNDIVTSLSGKMVEIISTDAEGRLVLADALTYAHTHYQPRAVIDLATLTGGVVIALGKVRAGVFSNNDALAQALIEAGERVHERLWRLPLDDDYFELIKGEDSDLRNSSALREAHPIVGGIFLKQFVPDEVPWAHLDIAGPATTEKPLPYYAKGATGFGLRLVLDYLQRLEP